MKSRTQSWIVTMTLLSVLSVSLQTAAQDQKPRPASYTVIDLGTLGGTFSIAQGMNNQPQVVGQSTLPGDTQAHAFLWQKGVMTDLGTLGGPNSASFFPLNERGDVAGLSDTFTSDPQGEDFCGFGTHLRCLPFVWQKGVMTSLPTLGGNNGLADEINDRAQVVGRAENSTPDSTCVAPQVLQSKPVVWEKGEVQELPTFSGDPDGEAAAINDRGQAAGHSGNCTTVFHALLWENGTVTDLGNLGGTMSNLALDINNQGQVVGLSDLLGDTTFHAFLWQDGVMMDLGTLPGDVSSIGEGINSKGQVVGISVDASGNERAFLWQNGVMTDLNTLIPAGSPLSLLGAITINDRGQIAGIALQISTGEVLAFLATPCEGDQAHAEGCEGRAEAPTAAAGEIGERPKIVLPESVRKLLPQRLGFGRFVGSRREAALNSTAATSGPNATLSTSRLIFECRNVINAGCQCINRRTVTLSNLGTQTLTIHKITISGPFHQGNNCGSSLAAGKSCTITITWSEIGGGGTLSVFDNAPGSPQKVSLLGEKFCTPI